MLSYKDFPKSDARRYFVVLLALERLKSHATLHYVAQELTCTRSEVQRAIEIAQAQFGVQINKVGPVYTVLSWGVLKRQAVHDLVAQGVPDKNACTVALNGL